MMGQNLVDSIALLTSACIVLAEKCVAGIEPNTDRLKAYAESSPSIGTALTPYIGYEAAAEIIKESTRTGKSIRQIVRARKLMTDADLDRALDVEAMTKGGIVG
jgi:aspartate ammonia-lyase